MADKPQDVVFLLVENFSHMAFACALEPLRIANLAAERELYRWHIAAENGVEQRCSNGTVTRADIDLKEMPNAMLIVVAGLNAKRHATPAIKTYLRRHERLGSGVIGAICCGAYVLAEAGMLDGRSCALHWGYHDAFMEDHPEVDLDPSVFVMDGRYVSSSGGTAATDMMLRLIEDAHGSALSRQTAERLVYTSVRAEGEGQRHSANSRIGIRNARLAKAVEFIESDLDEPMRTADVAARVGLSPRQLERLFGRYLHCSPKKYRMEMRLNRARELLRQTEMSVINVALACGFTSPSHFSKCYRTRFGSTPYQRDAV
ncbi:GlxA family transcriptional regulator [Pikeienuella piscinae]|uniref:GlxA family transcriptional regulator n=1 Tax=Pikeienuella piscinae TaxID=2748098 RepID=A0A7L5BSJ0_9RHOB|nr:GlxA family transcriptional regulator [Pikeienuella piscinae]QIE54330.1 GlxA family transcriptional regulator [Pikeienuella piscinae]